MVVTYRLDEEVWYVIRTNTLDVFHLRDGRVWKQAATFVITKDDNGKWGAFVDDPLVKLYDVPEHQMENVRRLEVSYSQLLDIARMNDL